MQASIEKNKPEKLYNQSAPAAKHHKYYLKLYIAGLTPQSIRAIDGAKKLCRKYLRDNSELEIIDIYQHSNLKDISGSLAIPTLLRKYPLPSRELAGDLSDVEKLLTRLIL
jgi:circadian clock protein KaiB